MRDIPKDEVASQYVCLVALPRQKSSACTAVNPTNGSTSAVEVSGRYHGPAIPTNSSISSTVTVCLFVGVPEVMVTNKGSRFISEEFETFRMESSI